MINLENRFNRIIDACDNAVSAVSRATDPLVGSVVLSVAMMHLSALLRVTMADMSFKKKGKVVKPMLKTPLELAREGEINALREVRDLRLRLLDTQANVRTLTNDVWKRDMAARASADSLVGTRNRLGWAIGLAIPAWVVIIGAIICAAYGGK